MSEIGRDGRLLSWGRLNWEFHATLYSKANQPRLMMMIRNTNNSGERYARLQLALTNGIERANEEHYRMLEFFRKRSITPACNLLREHIDYARQSLSQMLYEDPI